MTYYSELLKMRTRIKELLKASGKFEEYDLTFQILETFAVSETKIREYIDALVNMNYAKREGTTIIWNK